MIEYLYEDELRFKCGFFFKFCYFFKKKIDIVFEVFEIEIDVGLEYYIINRNERVIFLLNIFEILLYINLK